MASLRNREHHRHEPFPPLSTGVCAICLEDRLTQLASLRSGVNQPSTNSHQHEATSTASGVCAICLEDRLAQLASSRSGVNEPLFSPSPHTSARSDVNEPLIGPPAERSARSGVNQTLLRPGANEPLTTTDSDRPCVNESLLRTLATISARPDVKESLCTPPATLVTTSSYRSCVNTPLFRPPTGPPITTSIPDISGLSQPGDGYLGRSKSVAVGKTLAELLRENRSNSSNDLLTMFDKSKSVGALTGSCQLRRGGGFSSSFFLTWLKPSASSLSFRYRSGDKRKPCGISSGKLPGKPVDAVMGDASVCISRSSSTHQQQTVSSGACLGSSFALTRRSKSRGTIATDTCQSSQRHVDGNRLMETDTSTCFTEWSEDEFTGQLGYSAASIRAESKDKIKNSGNYGRRSPGWKYGWAHGLPRPVRRVVTLLLAANKGGQEEEKEKKESGGRGDEESLVLESCFCTTSISCFVYMHHH